MNRRSFIQTTLAAVGLLSVLPSVVNSQERRRGSAPGAAGAAGPKLVDPNSAEAKAVNYVHNIKDVKDAKIKIDRMGVKFPEQKCVKCMFYVQKDEKTVDKMLAAPCQMPFAAGKYVGKEGFCTTWAKKA